MGGFKPGSNGSAFTLFSASNRGKTVASCGQMSGGCSTKGWVAAEDPNKENVVGAVSELAVCDRDDREVWEIEIQLQTSFSKLRHVLTSCSPAEVRPILFTEGGVLLVVDVFQLRWLLRRCPDPAFSREILFDYDRVKVVKTPCHVEVLTSVLSPELIGEVQENRDNSALFDVTAVQPSFEDLLAWLMVDGESVVAIRSILFVQGGMAAVHTIANLTRLGRLVNESVRGEIADRFQFGSESDVIEAVLAAPKLAEPFLFVYNGMRLLSEESKQKLLEVPEIDDNCKSLIRGERSVMDEAHVCACACVGPP